MATSHSERNALFSNVNAENAYLYGISNLNNIGGMLYELIGKLRDVNKSVLVNTNVNKCAKVDNVTHGSGQFHIGLEVLDAEDIIAQNGRRKRIADVAAGLFKLAQNILKSRLTNAELCGNVGNSLALNLGGEVLEITLCYILFGLTKVCKQGCGCLVGFGVNAGVIEDFLTAGNTQKACCLLVCLGTDARNL